MNVSVLNSEVETFETMPVELGFESVNGHVKKKIDAYTTNRVTGDMNVVHWNKFSKEWKHLKGINFPKVSSRLIVDVI